MAAHNDETLPSRQPPAYRRDGAYSLLVFLHAQTVARSGWDRTDAPSPAEAPKAMAEAQAVLEGLERYRLHPFRRFAPEPPVLWRAGAVRVLDFGGSGPPVLAVPSMVNGMAIMDLSPQMSPLRWLARQGFRVFLVDWGVPGGGERAFGLGEYLHERLIPAFDAVTRAAGRPAHLIGYCMGGPLMLALAQRRRKQVGRVVTLGAPWHFCAFPEHEKMREKRGELEAVLRSTAVIFGQLPSQMTQSFFALRDLASGVRKFRHFATVDPMSAEARRFVAVEDWLNDGVPLAPKVAEECFLGWLVDDVMRQGKWAPAGMAFDPEDVAHQALVICAERDSVVRPEASEPLAEVLPNATMLRAPVGHIGMVVGINAIETVWKPIVDFLTE